MGSREDKFVSFIEESNIIILIVQWKEVSIFQLHIQSFIHSFNK